MILSLMCRASFITELDTNPPYILIPTASRYSIVDGRPELLPGADLLRLYVTVNSEFTLPAVHENVVRWGVIDPLDLKEWLTTNCLDS